MSYYGGYGYETGEPIDPKGQTPEQVFERQKKVYEWANIEEFFAEFVKPAAPGCPQRPGSTAGGAKKSALLKGTMRKVRLGWADPEMKAQLKKFHDLYQFIKATVATKLPRVQYLPKVVGSRANIAGIVVGDPRTALGRKPITDAQKRKAKSGLIRLCCNVDAFAGIGPDYFFIRGAAMCALAEALEAAKFRVEITIAIASIPLYRMVKRADGKLGFQSHYDWTSSKDVEKARRDNQRYLVKLKPFATPIAPLQVAFAMMHPSVLRTLFFDYWRHNIPADNGENQVYYNGSCGAVGVVPEGHDGTFDVYIAGFDPHNPASSYSDKDGAVKWILETLKGFGVEVGK
jgi:hypothetical protein